MAFCTETRWCMTQIQPRRDAYTVPYPKQPLLASAR